MPVLFLGSWASDSIGGGSRKMLQGGLLTDLLTPLLEDAALCRMADVFHAARARRAAMCCSAGPGSRVPGALLRCHMLVSLHDNDERVRMLPFLGSCAECSWY